MTVPDAAVWAVIALAGIGTFSIRASFMALADRLTSLPDHVLIALQMVPAAAMAALTVPALLRPDGTWDVLGPRALAGVVAAIVAVRTRSALATVIVGLLAVIGLDALLG